MKNWKPGPYLIARPEGIIKVWGYTYRGLGLHMKYPEGLFKTLWCLTHLNSGHRINYIRGTMPEAMAIATETAHVTEWDFDGLDGWKNREPDLKAKMKALDLKHLDHIVHIDGAHPVSPDKAREILMKRLDEPVDKNISKA